MSSKLQAERWMFMSGGFKADPVLMVRGNGNAIAVIHKGDSSPKSMQRQRAEAALLSVAPEMLDALETLLLAVEVDKVEGIGHATDKAKAVIAKAKVGGFVHAPSGLLDAAKEMIRRYDIAEEDIPEDLSDEDGQRFLAAYLESIGQGVDLLRGHVAEAEGEAKSQ